MARSKLRRQDQDPPCDTDSSKTHWMINEQGVDPCVLVEQLMHVCASGSPITLGPVTGDLTCPLSGSSCCCSVATYALLSACWVCQGHKVKEIDAQIQRSYADFLQGCPDPEAIPPFPNDIQPQVQSLHVPSWALIHPENLNDHWNFFQAQANASMGLQPSNSQPPQPPQPPPSQTLGISVISPSSSSTGVVASSSPVLASFKSSTPPGTIAASVLGSLALVAILYICGWLFWRWRRRRAVRPSRGAKVDLIEPEMQGHPSLPVNLYSGDADHLQRSATFPFPYEGVVPRYHPDARHSIEPSRSDEEPSATDRDRTGHASRRHTAPAPLLYSKPPQPVDQLDRDLASLKGPVELPTGQLQPGGPRLGEGTGQAHHPGPHKASRKRAASITTFSSNSGSNNSRRARRKSGANGEAQGKYFHLPPSAQYLADIARYPETVDPERPWDVRRDCGGSRYET